MNNYKSILLLKLPYCIYVEHKQDMDFMDRTNFRPLPSIALASICGFFDKYKSIDYTLKAIDINIEAYQNPGEPIDPSLYKDLLTNAIKDNDYGILAMSAMFLYNIRWVELAVKLSRQYHPEAKIIIGGGYPTVFPKEAVEKHDIDFAVIGEGEAAFLHILNKINNHTDLQFEKSYPFENYATKDDAGKVVVVPRKTFTGLEGLPSPNWDYLNVDKYFKNSGDRVLPMESSRGCPYTCTFCASFLAWGRKMRYKPVDNVIAEVQQIYLKHKVSGVYFTDDNISFS
ncbi:MAG: cobalamin-dependent protein [Candidatus Omnitrophota bacterium]